MNGSPSLDDIITALNRTGYLMEQQVATQLEALDLHVWTNWAFEDPDEGKSREMDLRAIKRVAHNEQENINAFLEIIVECKNNANPLVFIGRPKSETDDRYGPEELVFPIPKYEKQRMDSELRIISMETDAFFHLGFDQVHHDFVADTKAVQFCRIDRAGKAWKANHGGLYDAIFYPMAKAVTARKREALTHRRGNAAGPFWFFVPMVVTSSDIFYVDSTLADPTPEARDFVTFKRQIRSGSVDGTFAINFVRQDQIEHFFSECLEPLVSRMNDLTMNSADFILKRVIPWKD